MSKISPVDLLSSLLHAGHQAAYESFELSKDYDEPIYQESLVQVEVAKALNRRFGFDRVELESCTVRLARVMSGIHPKHASFPKIERHGKVDIVCWQAMAPQILIEVKDQITGTDDGLIEDLCRLQDFLKIEHKWNKRKRAVPWFNLPQYGALVFFVGKNSESYKNDRYLASHFKPYADKTVETVIKNKKTLFSFIQNRLG